MSSRLLSVFQCYLSYLLVFWIGYLLIILKSHMNDFLSTLSNIMGIDYEFLVNLTSNLKENVMINVGIKVKINQHVEYVFLFLMTH